MKKKSDVWNYYQRCLVYQAVRQDKLEQVSIIIPSSYNLLFNQLALCSYQVNAKFETYLEKCFLNANSIEHDSTNSEEFTPASHKNVTGFSVSFYDLRNYCSS